jgi:hypothetical protein
MKIEYRAADHVRAIINSLGRTEDVRFSPSNRRLAIAAFNRSRIAVFDVEIAKLGGTPDVSLTGAVEISSSSLRYPHGVDFLDDETLAVANREGDVAIFKIPPAGSSASEQAPIQVLAAASGSLLFTPGSLAVVRGEDGLHELLVCNNYADSVTRHVMDRDAGCAITKSEVLLSKWLNLPDGLCVSQDRRWIAISNHNTHGVLLYERSSPLNEDSSPDGVLRGVCFPHGLRFSADGRYLFVADAGAPFVHIYSGGGQGWRGARLPAASIRMMDDLVFQRGRKNPQEGGPKGVDFDKSMCVLATTCEYQPLQFLDLAAVLATVPSASPVVEAEYELGVLEVAAQLKKRARQAEERAAVAEARAAAATARAVKAEANAAHEERRAAKFKAKAEKAKAKVARAKARAGFVINGRPWRITAPLSRLYSALKGLN